MIQLPIPLDPMDSWTEIDFRGVAFMVERTADHAILYLIPDGMNKLEKIVHAFPIAPMQTHIDVDEALLTSAAIEYVLRETIIRLTALDDPSIKPLIERLIQFMPPRSVRS